MGLGPGEELDPAGHLDDLPVPLVLLGLALPISHLKPTDQINCYLGELICQRRCLATLTENGNR